MTCERAANDENDGDKEGANGKHGKAIENAGEHIEHPLRET